MMPVRFSLPGRYVSLAATLAVLILLYVAGCLSFDRFASVRVVVNLFNDNSFLGIAAIGATTVIISGGIDLSVGSVVAASSILIASLIGHGMHPLVAMAITVVAGALFGTLQGLLIACYRLPSFLVTLGGMFFIRGLGFSIEPQSLGITHPFVSETLINDLALHFGKGVALSSTASLFLLILLIAMYLLHQTRFGRSIYAVGGDEASARLMGLAIERTRILTYAFAGACSSLAGVAYAVYTQSGDPACCVGFELDAIAAVVIGGTLLKGGVGFVVGTAMGVLILGLIQTLIAFKGDLNSWWTRIAIGALVLIFILLQDRMSRFRPPANATATTKVKVTVG